MKRRGFLSFVASTPLMKVPGVAWLGERTGLWSFNDTLKELYQRGRVERLLHDESPFLKMIERERKR